MGYPNRDILHLPSSILGMHKKKMKMYYGYLLFCGVQGSCQANHYKVSCSKKSVYGESGVRAPFGHH
jgi:hypothetical protein